MKRRNPFNEIKDMGVVFEDACERSPITYKALHEPEEEIKNASTRQGNIKTENNVITIQMREDRISKLL